MEKRTSRLVVVGSVPLVLVALVMLWPGDAPREITSAETIAEAPAATRAPVELRDEHLRPEPVHEREEAAVAEPVVADEPQRTPDLVGWLQRAKPDVFGELGADEIAALTELDLRGVEVTDDDLALIGQLKNLRILSLYGSPITDAGLKHLAGLHELESVVLRGTKVTGIGLQYLPAQNLTALHLCNSQITAEDLRFTPIMPKLERLKLNFLEFEDDVIETLNVYPALRHIELDQSKLTDAGLARLLELNPGLQRIEMRNTQVTASGAAEIARRYPNCELVRDTPWIATGTGR